MLVSGSKAYIPCTRYLASWLPYNIALHGAKTMSESHGNKNKTSGQLEPARPVMSMQAWRILKDGELGCWAWKFQKMDIDRCSDFLNDDETSNYGWTPRNHVVIATVFVFTGLCLSWFCGQFIMFNPIDEKSNYTRQRRQKISFERMQQHAKLRACTALLVIK